MELLGTITLTDYTKIPGRVQSPNCACASQDSVDPLSHLWSLTFHSGTDKISDTMDDDGNGQFPISHNVNMDVTNSLWTVGVLRVFQVGQWFASMLDSRVQPRMARVCAGFTRVSFEVLSFVRAGQPVT